jgi:hypothetical protein
MLPEQSYFIVERVLHNSVNVMTRQRDELGLKEYPLYTHDEVDDIAPVFQGFRYNREVEWAAYEKSKAGFASPTLEFYDAGHTLGSAGIMIRGQKETRGLPATLLSRPNDFARCEIRGCQSRRADHGNHSRESRCAQRCNPRHRGRTAHRCDLARAQA